ncbi:MAG: hypothetical protein O7E56_13185, partial [SAR324 cluster bacterium]|nr:hypothetical protein [SAR324 cluster bacterium]
EELLAYAEELILQPAEISIRNAAGRAFYAAYHACSPINERLDPGLKFKEGTHQKLIRLFTEYDGADDETSGKVRALGWMYKQVRDLRSKTDYEIEMEFTLAEAQVLLGTAKRIVDRATELGRIDF